MKFSLPDTTKAKLVSVNFRSQLHGDEHVPAVDIGFLMDSPNSVLSEFDGWLLTSLYYSSAASQGQEHLPDVERTTPNLRFPKLGMPLKWDDSGKGYELTIEHGLGESSNIVLDLCDVGEFRLTPKEGGTVEIKFRVQCSSDSLTEAVRGKLSGLIQSEVEIRLMPPEVEVSNDAPTRPAAAPTDENTSPLPFDADTPDEAGPAEGSPEAAFLDTVRERAASTVVLPAPSESSVVSITRKKRRGAAVE